MCGQLYCGHANAMALSSSPVVSALGSESDDLGSSPGQGKALCPWDVRALLLGLAKSIYYVSWKEIASNTFFIHPQKNFNSAMLINTNIKEKLP